MLTRFRADNFRNLINVEVRPGRINLLVGPNNAGKTNLCNAIRFVSASASFALDEAVGRVLGENWNITNAYFPDQKIELEADMILSESGTDDNYHYALKLNADREALTGKQVLQVLEERLFVTGGAMRQIALIHNDAGVAQVFDEKSQSGSQTQVPAESTALSKLFDPEANKRAVMFRQHLGNCWYFNLNPRAASASSPRTVRTSLTSSMRTWRASIL
jgi:predicted ATPase